jgi:hypothetical protein
MSAIADECVGAMYIFEPILDGYSRVDVQMYLKTIRGTSTISEYIHMQGLMANGDEGYTMIEAYMDAIADWETLGNTKVTLDSIR